MKPIFFSAIVSNFMAAEPETLRTSAPAEKKRPSPVGTVKIVFGFSLSFLIASIVSRTSLPPKEFSVFARLNYLIVRQTNSYLLFEILYLDDANLALDLDYDVLVVVHVG
jgi:hypothetical protein